MHLNIFQQQPGNHGMPGGDFLILLQIVSDCFNYGLGAEEHFPADPRVSTVELQISWLIFCYV